MFSHRGLSDRKSPQVAKTLLSIMVDFNNAEVSVVFLSFSDFKLFHPLSKPLRTIPIIMIITPSESSTLALGGGLSLEFE